MISEELRVLDDKLHKVSDNITAAYNKITEKGGTPTGTTSLELAESIDTIPEGGGGEPISFTNDDLLEYIRFFDYDGTLIYKALPSEVAEWSDYSKVTALLPQHNNLTFATWSLDLAELQSLNDWADVGACYTPTDNKGEVIVSINNPNTAVTFADSGNCTYDWGDGSSDTSSNNVSLTHTYAAEGQYTIKITGTPTWWAFTNQTARYMTDTLIMPPTVNSSNTGTLASYHRYCGATNIIFSLNYPNIAATDWSNEYNISIMIGRFGGIIPQNSNMLRVACYKVNTNTAINSILERFRFYGTGNITTALATAQNSYGAFTYCVDLSKGVDSSNNTNTYSYMTSVKVINPARWVNRRYSAIMFSGCHNLIDIKNFYQNIGSKITQLNGAAFKQCYKLQIPLKFDNLTTIAAEAFYGCGTLPTIDFSNQTVVPTLAATSAFTNCSANFLIPDALYDTWIAATNWATMYTLAPDRFVRV